MMFRLIIFILAILGCLWIRDNVQNIEGYAIYLKKQLKEVFNEK